MSEDLDDWQPMSDDFQSMAFNSYCSGQTAAHLSHNLAPGFGYENRRPPKLYIDGFPSDLTETGLKNFVERVGCKPLSVKIIRSKTRADRHFSFVDFESRKEAQKAVELLRSQKLYKLSVSFALTERDRKDFGAVVEKERQSFQRLISKQIEMKQKLDIGNCSAINASSNGNASALSPIHSESGSRDSSHLDVLSPLAKSDKLLKVLERSEDDCSVCAQKQPLEHLHFILSEQQVVDPTQMPPLIEVTNVCQTCGRTADDLKLCSQCKSATYCDRNCQSGHWPRHRLQCKINSNEFLSLNSTLNSSKTFNGNVSQIEGVAEPMKTVSAERTAPERVVPITAIERMTKTTPQITNTVRGVPKESTPIMNDNREGGDFVDGVRHVSEKLKDLEIDKPVRTLPKEVIKTAATKDIPNEKSKTENKLKVMPIKTTANTVDNEVLIDGEDGLILCFGRSPFDFHLQKSSADERMSVFADEIYKKMNEFPELSDQDLKPGTLCGGIYSADGNCYRARIVDKVKDNTYALYFIDYGNTEPVEKKDIKRLPQIFFSCKAQALHCSLDKIVPKGKVWSKEAIALFGEIGESNEYSKVKIFGKTNEDIYKIDLFNPKGETLCQKFVEKGFASFGDELTETRVKTPVSSPTKAPITPIKSDSPVIVEGSPKVTFNKSSIDEIANYIQPMPSLEEKSEVLLKSYLELKESNSENQIMITNIFNSEDFHYMGTVFKFEVQELIVALAEDYPSVKQTVIPEVGDFVVVKGSDDEFYRSYVLALNPKGAKVFTIDSGYIEDISKDKIFKMDDKFRKIPVYGVMLLPNTTAGARLIELSHANESTIDGILIKSGGKIFLKNDDVSIELYDFKSTIDFIKNLGEKVLNGEEIEAGDPYNDLPLRQLPLNKEMESLALYQDQNDFKIFYVAGDAEDCQKLMNLCADYSTKFDDNIKVNPLPRNVYLVRSSGDNEWYRALVYGVDGDNVRVKYIDFGNDEEIDIKYVMELCQEIQTSTIKPLAIKCKVESSKLGDEELKTKIEKGTEGAFLLKLKVIRIEGGFHFVKVK